MSPYVIGFVGMTHLGLNSAVAGAERGFRMICFDEDNGLIADLSAGRMPVVDPQLDELVARNRDRLAFTGNPAALAASAVVYVAPDEIGRAHVWTPVTNAHIVCRLLLDKKKQISNYVLHLNKQ